MNAGKGIVSFESFYCLKLPVQNFKFGSFVHCKPTSHCISMKNVLSLMRTKLRNSPSALLPGQNIMQSIFLVDLEFPFFLLSQGSLAILVGHFSRVLALL